MSVEDCHLDAALSRQLVEASTYRKYTDRGRLQDVDSPIHPTWGIRVANGVEHGRSIRQHVQAVPGTNDQYVKV